MPFVDSGLDLPIDEQYAKDDDETRTFTSWVLTSIWDLLTPQRGRTLATTTTMFRHENGRTYHAYRDGEYWQPNDAQQNNHEGIYHHMCIMTLRDRLTLAPLDNPKRILDLGTGTGIWASDIADQFPDCQVTGMDLSPIQPSMQPPNCTFEIDDCTSRWVYPDDHFDFVHLRGLFGSIADWPALYKQIYKHTAPGGYIEQVEWNPHVKSQGMPLERDHVLRQWGDLFIQIEAKIGKDFGIGETMAKKISAAGFTDVVERRFKWPVGPWSSDPRMKEIGRWNLLNWEQGMEGWVLAAFTRVLGWSYADVQTYLSQVRKALRSRRYLLYHEVHLVYARKPS